MKKFQDDPATEGGKTEIPSYQMMKRKKLLFLCFLLILGIFFCQNGYAADDPIVAEIEVSPSVLTAPGTVNVKITVSNSGDKDMQDPIYLYTPQGKTVSDFGTDGSIKLKAGESKTWTGTYDVNNRTLEDGKIVYYVKYTLYDSNGQSRSEKQPLTASISKGNAGEGLQVERIITPNVTKEGQEIVIKYTIQNNGDGSLYNITIQENKSIHKEKDTIQELKPGKQAEIVYKIQMGKKNLTSAATITYATSEKGKSKTYKAEEQVITLGQSGLEVALESSVKGVIANGTVKLKLNLKNTGTVAYTDIRVNDPTLGEVFSGEELAAGKTLTLEKEITVPETMDFQFTVNSVDETGSEISLATNPLTITAISENDALKLDVSMTADHTEVFSIPGTVRFAVTIANNSNVDAKNVVLTHGDVTITTLPELKKGESRTIHRDVAVSHSGRFRFTATAIDPLENHVSFSSNDIQIVISAPTVPPATPTPVPVPTPVPTVPVFTMPSVEDPSIAPEIKSINSLMKPLLYVFAGLFFVSAATLISAKVKRKINQNASKNALDSLEVSEHRDYSQKPDVAKQQQEIPNEEIKEQQEPDLESMMDVTDPTPIKYAQKAGFSGNNPEIDDEEENRSISLDNASFQNVLKEENELDYQLDLSFQPKEEPGINVDFSQIDSQNSPRRRRGNGQPNA